MPATTISSGNFPCRPTFRIDLLFLTEIEGIFDQLNFRECAGLAEHSDHVKPCRSIDACLLKEVVLGNPADLALLPAGHGSGRGTELLSFSAFDLDKNQGVAIGGDDIYFAKSAAEISGDDAVATSAEFGNSQCLSSFAEELPVIGHAPAPH